MFAASLKQCRMEMRYVSQSFALSLALVLLIALGAARAEDWPSFRGLTGMGLTQETELPLEWGGPDDKNILWKAPLPATVKQGKPDQNQSSPIVWRDRVFVATAFWPADRPQGEPPEQHVTCYAIADGRQLWDSQVPAGPWKLGDLRGGYAAPTPATDGQRIYAVFGSAVIAALDMEGKILWRHELADWQSFDVAIASSPIVYGGRVILLADKNNQKSTLTAYDCQSGNVVWEQKRPQVAFDHTTPVIVDVGGKTQMFVAASNELQALNPQTGERLWWCKAAGDVCSPVYARGLVYSDSGRGGPGVGVDPTGQGDVTATHLKWTIPQIPEGLSSPVIVGDFLYRTHNPGILKCFELASGKEVYSTRLEGVSTPSSPIATPSGRIYFASAGKSFVVQAGPAFELLATNDLGEPTAASAAVSQGKLLLKGQKTLFCVGKKR